MPRYRVQVATTGREVYEVEAENEDAAWDDWYDGELINSEVRDYEPVDVEEIED